MSKQFERAIELAKKTGDRVIVFNGPEDSNGYVILPFSEYEKVIDSDSNKQGLTQDEMIDNINRDVAEWKNGHSFGFSEPIDDEKDEYFEKTIPDITEEVGEHIEIDENPQSIYTEDENDEDGEDYEDKFIDTEKTKTKKSAWKIPPSRKTAAEEIIEEDRHYLEEIPF